MEQHALPTRRGPLALWCVSLFTVVFAQCSEPAQEVTIDERFSFPKHNVLFVTFDALRADHLGCYGYERDTSPNLDAFAKEAYVFTDAMAQSGTTVYSFASMFTGRFPCTDQLVQVGNDFGLKDSELTFPEILKEKGYNTAAVVGHDFARAQYGFGQGFDVFRGEYEDTELAEETLARALEVLDELEGPFFFWLHIRQPHSPWEALEEDFRRFYDAAPGEPTLLADRHRDVLEHFAETEEVHDYTISGRTVPMTATMIKQLEAKYDGNLVRGDKAFGELMAELEERNLSDNTVVVVAADHGESMGEHYVFDHNLLYWGILHTPIMVRTPQRVGERRDYPVMNVDIMPTILQMLGFEVPGGIRGIQLFEEQRENYYQLAEYADSISIKVGDHRVVERPNTNTTSVFNVVDDPFELRSLVDADPDLAEKLRQMARSIRSPAQTDDLMDELRALGYAK